MPEKADHNRVVILLGYPIGGQRKNLSTAQATTETCSLFSPIFGSLHGQGAPRPIARTRTQQRRAGPRNNTARVPENLELLLH